MDELLKLFPTIANQSIWCCMFLYLFWDVQKKNAEREHRYNDIIDTQSQKLEEISQTLEKINDKLNST